MSDLQRVWAGLSRDQMLVWAGHLAAILADSAAVAHGGYTVGLTGDLGAGKTTFSQGLVGALVGGKNLYVTSPTYAIIQVYDCDPQVRHVDLYRIASMDELEAIGYAELTEAPGLNLVEWIRRVPEAIPPDWLEIDLAATGDGVRDLRARAGGARSRSILEKVSFP